jgi:hypothetical protein
MSRLLLDYDPLTGVTESLDFAHEGGKHLMRVVQEQDVSRFVEFGKAMSLDEDYTKQGIKNDHWHYARIPHNILQEMKVKHGVSWEDKNDKGHKRFLRVLNREYPVFKMTAYTHE